MLHYGYLFRRQIRFREVPLTRPERDDYGDQCNGTLIDSQSVFKSCETTTGKVPVLRDADLQMGQVRKSAWYALLVPAGPRCSMWAPASIGLPARMSGSRVSG